MDNILLAIDSRLTLSKATALNYALEALHRILSEIKALLFVHLICFHEVIQLFSFQKFVDGNNEIIEEYYPLVKKSDPLDFDSLLQLARKQAEDKKKKNV